MLLRFVAANFLSIHEEVEFNMFPYPKLKTQVDHIYKTSEIDLLKVAAIYGANGSGKSNLVKALHYLHDMVVDKNNRFTDKSIHYRLSSDSHNEPSKFEVEFRIEGNYYAYGLELLDNEILEEWLYQTAPTANTSQLIFLRKKEDKGGIYLDVSAKYKQTEKESILIQLYADEILDHKTPFLFQVRDKKQYPEIKEAYRWFSEKLFIIHPDSRFTSLVNKIIENKKFKKFTNSVLPKLDTGVQKIEVKKVPLEIFFGDDDKDIIDKIRKDLDGEVQGMVFHSYKDEFMASKGKDGEILISKIITKHRGENDSIWDFDLEEESDGTRRLLDLLPAVELLSDQDVVFVVDEIGRSLHPSLLKEFLTFFLSQKTKGQFIFTTHESNLLDLKIFRQDEIWFVEKNKAGSTNIYPLTEFKPRYDLDIRKGYLNGRFGAIPFLGNLQDLNWKDATKE